MRKPKLAYSIFLGAFMIAFTLVACNNNSETKKDAGADTTKMNTMSSAPMKDTTKMDTSKTRPVQPGN